MNSKKRDGGKANLGPIVGLVPGLKWEVWHSEGCDYGFPPELFCTKARALKMAAEWNKRFPGHIVRRVKKANTTGERPETRSESETK